ncbi:MAG: DNA polymerase I [Planctomycetota bacterium]
MAGRLFLVDGTALAYRSHFAFIQNPLTTSKGEPTSATFGYYMAIQRIVREERPDSMVVAFDRREPTFRKKRYPAYKATREKAPDDLIGQLPVIKKLTEALGIPVLELAGFEADDIIGTAAVRGEKAGFEVLIVSGDKDMMQLVTEKVRIYDISKQGTDPVILGIDGVKEKFGVTPDKVVDVLGLMGDTSDNVPGVPLVGPKKALALIEEHGSLERVLETAPAAKPNKTNKNLVEFAEQALLSKELVTIDMEVPIETPFDKLEPGSRDVDALADIFARMEFTAFLNEVRQEQASESVAAGYSIVDDDAGIDALLSDLRANASFVFDTETSELDPYSARIVGLSFAHTEGEAVYVPIAGCEGRLEKFRGIFEDAGLAKAGQNMKYDVQVLRTNGIEVQNLAFDTMVASYLLDPGRGQHNLDAMSLKHLGIKKTPTEDLIGKGKGQISMLEVSVEDISKYAAEDADCTFRLMKLFEPRLEEEDLVPLFREVEMPLVRVLLDMERAGVRIDSDYLSGMSLELGESADRLTGEIHEMAGEEFNINSPKQLGPILFERLEIQKGSKKRLKRTKTGYSTDATTLANYADHPIVAKLLEYREVVKLRSTYVDALPKLVHKKTGRIHSSFNQTVAATGRLSSQDPNLQNIPIRTELGKRIRKAFVADAGCRLVCADYNQIELRLMAHLSDDASLLDVYARGGDVHTETAARMFGCEVGDVTREQRGRAKAINFGILYGMGPQRLARDLKISLNEGKEFLRRYFQEFPGVREFQRGAIEKARTEGFVTTLLGRRRVISEIESPMPGVRANAENMAMNTPLQGTAADLIKIAMIRVHQKLHEGDFAARMILQVHDELVFEAPEDECDALATMVRHEMEHAMELKVPIVVDVGMGTDWLEAH